MASSLDNENWVPLVEFSVKKGISLSTLRRYIKANNIPWKLLEGRYLVMDDGTFTAPRDHFPDPSPRDTATHLKKMERELMAANEEIAELKTLVAFYEETWSLQSKL